MSGLSIRAERGLGDKVIDPGLALAGILILGLGLVMLYSATDGYSRLSIFKPAFKPAHFLKRQLLVMALSLPCFLILAVIPPESLRRILPLAVGVVLIMQLLPLLPGIGVEKNGGRRWIGYGGNTFQPSELLKPTFIAYLAHIFDKKAAQGKSDSFMSGLLPPLALSSLAVALIFAQNDLSSALILALIVLAMFYASGVRLGFFAAMASLALPLLALSILTSSFRLQRIITFLFPGYDQRGISYQLMASIRAIRSGGLWGKGMGLGTYKVASIPEVQSDFIFSAIAEEVGLLGIVLLLALWFFFLWRCLAQATAASSLYSRLLYFGVGFAFFIQCLINVSVTVGFMPATGIALPLFSAGGSSVLASFLMYALLVQAGRSQAMTVRRGMGAKAMGGLDA